MKKFLFLLLASIALPSSVEALPYKINNNSREMHRFCASAMDYQECLKSYSKNSALTNTSTSTRKTYLFSVTNTDVGGPVHKNLNGANIIPTNSLRQCTALAIQQDQYFNEVSSSMTGDFLYYSRGLKGISEGSGNYKLYITAQNVYRPINATLSAHSTYIIPMMGSRQCTIAKLQVDNLASQMQSIATGDYYPEFYTKCIRSPF